MSFVFCEAPGPMQGGPGWFNQGQNSPPADPKYTTQGKIL